MQSIDLGGVQFSYELMGEGDETVAFLNGVAMSINHWKPIAGPLAGDYRCLLHDFRGQLMSGKPAGPYSLEQHADDVARLFDALGTEEAHLLGTSYGAEIGMIMGFRHPDRVKSLILIDGVSETDERLRAAVRSWKSAALTDPLVYYESLLPWNYSPGYLEAHAEELAQRAAAVAGLPEEYFRGFGHLCDAFLEIDITAHLPEIPCPTLVVVADDDILKPRRFSEIIREGIPSAHLEVIAGAGHAVVIEQPEEIVRLAREFYGGSDR